MNVTLSIPKTNPDAINPSQFPCFGRLRTNPQTVVWFTCQDAVKPSAAHGIRVTGEPEARSDWGWEWFDAISPDQKPEFHIVGGKPSFAMLPDPITVRRLDDVEPESTTGRKYPYLGERDSGRQILFLGPDAVCGREIWGKGWACGCAGEVTACSPEPVQDEISEYHVVSGDIILRNKPGRLPRIYRDPCTDFLVLYTGNGLWWFLRGYSGRFEGASSSGHTFWQRKLDEGKLDLVTKPVRLVLT